jgi:hypothetical protein
MPVDTINALRPSAQPPSAPTSAATQVVVAKPHGESPVALGLSLKTPLPLTHTAKDLSNFLGHSVDPKSLVCEVKTGKGGQMEVTVNFSGMWDGKYIRGAIRAIEHEYKKLKHNVTRMNAGKHSVTN